MSVTKEDNETSKDQTAQNQIVKEEQRFQAVLALLGGKKAIEVCQQYNISRSDLYKFKRRAVLAIKEAVANRQRGPHAPANKTSAEKERQIKIVCQRHPTLSSSQICNLLPKGLTTPRTIQRIRQRFHLVRLSKHDVPGYQRKQFSKEEKLFVRNFVRQKLYLGAVRLSWDLHNQHQIKISPSTVGRIKKNILTEMNPPPAPVVWRRYERKRPHSLWHGDFFEKITLTDEDQTAYQLTLMDDYSRGYVFCDLLREPTQNDTIKAMIAAMRQFQTIPKAVIFDNGSQFKGYLISAFCSNLEIRLIHSSVGHPQTNGKLERAFRDDKREYYDQFKQWIFDELRDGLPAYIRYRNEVRGHYALDGKPSITRLNEQEWFALPSVLDNLESFARQTFGSRKVNLNCCIRVLGRNGYIPGLRYRQMVFLTETLNGLEAKTEDGRRYLLRDYRKFRQRLSGDKDKLPFSFNFKEYSEGHCPRIPVV